MKVLRTLGMTEEQYQRTQAGFGGPSDYLSAGLSGPQSGVGGSFGGFNFISGLASRWPFN